MRSAAGRPVRRGLTGGTGLSGLTGVTGLGGLTGLFARSNVAGLRTWLITRSGAAPMRNRAAPTRGRSAGMPTGVADESESILLRALCHELRSPITALASLTRALADQPERLGEPDRQAMLLLARDQALHLDGVWRQAVTLTESMTRGPADIRVGLRRVLPAVLATAPPGRVRTRVSAAAGDWPVDGQRVRQTLVNLVDNALRHGPPEGRIRLSARVRAAELVLVVADEGRSCAALRAALRRHTPPPGMSGLGLWIVRRLVGSEGGSVTAYPLRPLGTAVEVRLPGRPPYGSPREAGAEAARPTRPIRWSSFVHAIRTVRLARAGAVAASGLIGSRWSSTVVRR